MSLTLILTAMILTAASGLPGFCFARSSVWGQRIATGVMVAAMIVGLAGACLGLFGHSDPGSFFPWPAAGNSAVGIDPLSSFFLVPILLMGGLGSIYSLGYWPQRLHPGNGRRLHLFWGLLTAGMALLVISRHAMAFLLGWEIMALAAFFLVATEDDRGECRRAALIYLIATHIGTLALFALFTLWRVKTGSFALEPVAGGVLTLGAMNGLFFLALIAFGLKAGMMPLHFWLPGAHAAAPSHVSAMLSGVVLKMGIYGLVRFLSLLPDPPAAWGGLILILGATSGLFGVVFAIGQHDLKRLLAYHSVENIGIILMGLGLAMLGRSSHRPEWVVLGMAGCLLHVWNHGLFKSLLFLCAGSVVHNTHTREIDRLGGLAKRMPWTAALFLIGAVAICGLPPLNGFVSEFLVYMGLLHTATIDGTSGSAVLLAVPVLAMIGALAVACFVKVYGVVFLGNSRGDASDHAKESPFTMRGPMLILAFCCVLIGLVPVLVSPLLSNVIAIWSPDLAPLTDLRTAAPFGFIGMMSVLLTVLIVVLTIVWMRRSRVSPHLGTWDCGYARPTSRIQYTASSFAQMIVSMFRWVLRPRVHGPHVGGAFPAPARMQTHVDDLVLNQRLTRAGHRIKHWFDWFRRFQQGLTQQYVLYILITVILMLGMLIPFDKYIAWLFTR